MKNAYNRSMQADYLCDVAALHFIAIVPPHKLWVMEALREKGS